MNRLCIYMTYNREQKIYEYMGSVLKALRECCSKVYLICNYEKINAGIENAIPYIDQIIYRKNLGFDAGAYKDILCNMLGWDEVRNYDELILVNDSFFGFFYPLQDTFYLMNRETCDFWGITGQTAGEFSNPIYKFEAHVHSYFLVLKKAVIGSNAFKLFWEQLVYPDSFRNAVINFEITINSWLRKAGFKGISYIDLYRIKLETNENPYYTIPCELVRRYKVPIMKKKSLLIRNKGFKEALDTIDYLKCNHLYSTDWIIPFLENQFYVPDTGTKICNSLEVFYRNHSHVYIYGSGVCGKNLAVYFQYKGWDCKGFIVTDVSKESGTAISIYEAIINSDTGIIISVINKKVAEEITKNIVGICRREQLFYISDCAAIKLPD